MELFWTVFRMLFIMTLVCTVMYAALAYLDYNRPQKRSSNKEYAAPHPLIVGRTYWVRDCHKSVHAWVYMGFDTKGMYTFQALDGKPVDDKGTIGCEMRAPSGNSAELWRRGDVRWMETQPGQDCPKVEKEV